MNLSDGDVEQYFDKCLASIDGIISCTNKGFSKDLIDRITTARNTFRNIPEGLNKKFDSKTVSNSFNDLARFVRVLLVRGDLISDAAKQIVGYCKKLNDISYTMSSMVSTLAFTSDGKDLNDNSKDAINYRKMTHLKHKEISPILNQIKKDIYDKVYGESNPDLVNSLESLCGKLNDSSSIAAKAAAKSETDKNGAVQILKNYNNEIIALYADLIQRAEKQNDGVNTLFLEQIQRLHSQLCKHISEIN